MLTKLLKKIVVNVSRYTLIGLMLQCFVYTVILANSGNAQIKSIEEIYVAIDLENLTIEEVFNKIENNTGFKFAYKKGIIDQKKRFSGKLNDQTLGNLLRYIAESTELSFLRVDEVIHVKKQEKETLNTVVETLSSQTRSISGRVTSNEDKEPLPGVNVIEKGTSNGTVTDIDGRYSFEVSEGATLVFSSVGFTMEEVVVGNRQTIDLVMILDIKTLQELVVVGYGVQKRSDITGSVTSVPKDRLGNLPVTNIMHAIQGTTAGLSITQDSSVPGSSGTMQIRGMNSINASTDPLIILDGSPFFGRTNDINPNDIESIEILKDASAVAIYGTRGANGVVLITTKRGDQSGKPRINYNGYVGTENIANVLEPMGPEAYVQKYADFNRANSITQTTILPNAAEIQNYNDGITTDWMDVASRTGTIQEHNLSVSGGTENVQYYVSGTNLNQIGVLKGYEYSRTSLRTNLDAKITDFLKVGASAFFTNNNYGGGRVNLLEATAMSPYSVPYDDQGNHIIYPMAPEQLFLNPLLELNRDRNDVGRNLTGNGYIEVSPGFVKGLKYRLSGSYALEFEQLNTYGGRLTNDQSGTAELRNIERNNWVVENILTYSKDIDRHHIDFTGLYSAQKVDYFRWFSRSGGFINDALSFNNIDAATTHSSESDANNYTMLSQMGRINYSYDSRYLLTATARRDGYSAFGANSSKYGLFPSLALGWNIHNESFMGNSPIFNELKLRVSYGKAGNMAIPVNRTISTASAVRWPFGGVATTGVLYNRLGNADLNWESTLGTNIALDYAILGNRIRGTVEVYKTVTDDLLMERNIPAIIGYAPNIQNPGRVFMNLGKVQNVGFEFTLNTVNIENDKFKWETNLNFSTYKNEILELYGDGKDDVGNRWFIGHPIRVIYDYEKIGIWQEGEEVANHDPGAIPGDLKFKDQDENGLITADDRIILGQRDPKWIGGFTNTFRYSNFNLSIFVQTSQGGMRPNRDLTYADEAGRRNIPAGFGYWTPENKDNYWPSLAAYKKYRGYSFSEDYSFVRIKDVRLSYVVPQSFLGRYGIEGLTAFVVGRNLYTFTNWFGWDPEMNYYSRGSSDNSGNWRTNYPVVRSFSFGLNLSL